jgi:hypothetical protein
MHSDILALPWYEPLKIWTPSKVLRDVRRTNSLTVQTVLCYIQFTLRPYARPSSRHIRGLALHKFVGCVAISNPTFRFAEGARAVTKHDRLAYGVMPLGVALGIVVSGRAGFICGAIGVLAGLVWIIISSAKRGSFDTHEKTEILVLVQEAHARALPQNDSDFDVFLRASLTSRTQFDLGIKEIQLTITASDSSSHWSGLQSPRLADRISGDLDKWHMGKERGQANMKETYVQTARESVPELNTTQPLKIDTPRVGWLHFRLRNITPQEFRTAPMELSVEDALFHKHVVAVNCARHLPGKVWPVRGRKTQKAAIDLSRS